MWTFFPYLCTDIMRRPRGDDSGYVSSPGSDFLINSSRSRQDYVQSTYSSRDTITMSSMDDVKPHQLMETFFSTPIICQFCKSSKEVSHCTKIHEIVLGVNRESSLKISISVDTSVKVTAGNGNPTNNYTHYSKWRGSYLWIRWTEYWVILLKFLSVFGLLFLRKTFWSTCRYDSLKGCNLCFVHTYI
jgi:hypothetical protein